MPGPSEEHLQDPGRGRRYRRIIEAFSSPDSYGLVLLLIIVTYSLSAALTASWAASLVLAVQTATVWVTLRASQARRPVRRFADVALIAVSHAPPDPRTRQLAATLPSAPSPVRSDTQR
jgi:hypothetical protein